MSTESPVQRYQRHQKQIGAAVTASAAVPALLALRSGRAAHLAEIGSEAARTASGLQLRHAGTATALGGIAGAINALPTPKRLLGQNPKRHRSPKIKQVLHRPATGRPPAAGYTRATLGKAADMIDAFGIDRPDLVAKGEIPEQFKEHAGRHHFTPDAPSAKAHQKKHAGRFHPAFLRHIGAHTFDGNTEGGEANEKSESKPKAKPDRDEDRPGPKFPAKKGHRPKKKLPAAFAERMGKRFVSEDERASLADKGKALPGGGFPIKNAHDLANAKRALGRAKNPAAARALINRRAKALGEPTIGKRDRRKAAPPGAARGLVRAARQVGSPRVSLAPQDVAAKNYVPPLPGLESTMGERTVDGIPESQHGSYIEKIEPVAKNYYYGSAPVPRQSHPGAASSGAAFLGAATGAAAAPQLRRVSLGPKAKAVKLALKAR